MMNKAGIYVHFPFCKRKCNYCDFVSFPSLCEEDKYIELLLEEISLTQIDDEIDTIYFGGGTPSILKLKNIEKILEAINKKYKLNLSESTIEVNPESSTEEKFKFYNEIGFNRISIGTQSLSNEILKVLGRLHTANQAIDTVIAAKKYFDNVSADLIIGLEGQTKNSVACDVKTLIEKGITHLSCYMLQLEEGTPLKKMVENKEVKVLSDENTIEIFDAVKSELSMHGFYRYEVSNFSLKNFESKHNVGYWKRKNYYGFGVAAHSLVNDKRYSNFNSINEYAKSLKSLSRYEDSILTPKDADFEKIMLGLRLSEGVPKDCLKGYEDVVERLGDYFVQGDYVHLNDKGLDVLNSILVEFLN